MALPLWLKEKLFQKRLLRDALREFDVRFDADRQLLFTEHHQSHAASAFFPSPFEDAAVLTMDGVGEWATTSVSLGRGHTLGGRSAALPRRDAAARSLAALYPRWI
jgi:carbamoyltransferase